MVRRNNQTAFPQSLPQYAAAMPNSQRVMRRPVHTFQVEARPFQIAPFMLAPVLPGETLQNLLLQARVVTDPIKHPLIGWWVEHYFFYVRHRDMALSPQLQAMMLDPSTDLSAYHATASDYYNYTYQGSVPWVDQCMDPVIKEYFRTPNEVQAGTWDDFKLDNLHLAEASGPGWMDSLTDTTVLDDGADLPDDADNATMESLSRLQIMYQALRDAQLVDMDYDDWLGTYGVTTPTAELPGRPELIRYTKSWQYPSNTVEPTTGVPASAVSWAVAERADKQRFFKEPGFIFGVTVARPKVYFQWQRGAAAGVMNNAFTWLPALMQDHPEISLREVADSASTATGGPLSTFMTNGYVMDVRDLLLYGDQFLCNVPYTETNNNFVALPSAAQQHRYPDSASIDALFKSASPANAVRQDGVVNLGISGRQRDMT